MILRSAAELAFFAMHHPRYHTGQALEDLRAICKGFVALGSTPLDTRRGGEDCRTRRGAAGHPESAARRGAAGHPAGAAVDADGLPELFRTLLVHNDHMTSVLNAFYRTTVRLRVLRERRGLNRYARMILLTHPDDGRVVEFGIARLNLDMIAAQVQTDILARRAPLGDILARHDVLRRVDPRWYFHFPAESPIARMFGDGAGPAYGRVGTIYCDEEPAIEVLEVVK